MLAHAGAPLAGDTQYGGTTEARMYLEQVVLGVARFGTGEWAAWQAPAHADREPWAPSLHTAVEAAAATARTAPPPPGPAR